MIKQTYFVALLSAAVLAQLPVNQSERDYTVMDRYYQGLYSAEGNLTVSQKVNYPGLFEDSISRTGIGFFQSYFSDNESNNNRIDLQDFYSWSECKTSIGRLGGYLGNMNLKLNSEEMVNDSKNQNGNVSAAIWFTPANSHFFRGLSIATDGLYKYFSSSGESNYINNNTIYSEKQENSDFYLQAFSLFQLSEKLHLNLGLSGQKGSVNNKFDRKYTTTDYYDSYYSSYSQVFSFRETKTKDYIGNISLGLIFNKNFCITAGTQINSYNSKTDDSYLIHTYSNYSGGYTYENMEESYNSRYLPGNGSLNFYLSSSIGKKMVYHKHKAYVGLNGHISAQLDVQDEGHISFSEVIKKVKKNQRYITGSLISPVTLEINLFNLPLYSIFQITPRLNLTFINSKIEGMKIEYRSFETDILETAFGIRGEIKDRFQFAIVPSFDSHVFVTGAELTYNLGSGKKAENSNKMK